MSNDQIVVRIINEQRKRCQASILGAAESAAWWSRLSRDDQAAFRLKVIDAVSVFYDLCRDVLKVADNDEVLRNERALQLVVDLHHKVDRMTRKPSEE